MTVQTLSDLVFHLRRTAGRPDLLSARVGQRRESLSTTDFLHQVHSLALALEARGVARGTRVAIFSENRPEWHVADFACQLLGAVTVPLFPTLPADRLGFILRNSSSRWVFYSDRVKRELLATLESTLTSPPEAVAFEGDAAFAAGASITRLMGEGSARLGDVPLERFRRRAEEDDPASILYAKDRAREPRGIVLSHRNLIANMLACDELFGLGPNDLALSSSPLAHGLQRTVDHLCLYRGGAIHYARTDDELPAVLSSRRPTLLIAAPEVYERMYWRIWERLEADRPLWRQLVRWGLSVGKRHADATRSGFAGPLLAMEMRLAALLAFRRIRRRFGGRLRLALCNGAALPRPIGEFFEAIGMPVCESYSLAETSPILAGSAPARYRPGSLGRALSAVELRVDENGEIQARGPGVMRDYWESPDASAESFTDSGWLRTGDAGTIDADGYVFLRSRCGDAADWRGFGYVDPRGRAGGRRSRAPTSGDDG